MKSSRDFPHQRFQTEFVIGAVLGLFYLIVNILVIGGDEFVFNLNSFLVSPLAILTVVSAAMLWRQMKVGAQNRILWGGVLLGWGFWMVAETLWAGYSILGQDPYPSPADFFFLAGYIPFSIGFLSRLWNLPVKPEKFQRVIYGAVSLVVILATTIFVFIPIVQSYDPQRSVESLLSLFYPLADLFLLLLVLRILFTYGAGDYGVGWRVILFGFITVTISDLVFSYADWNGLYYPDSRATFISTIGVDWFYNISYMLWALGIYILRILLSEHEILKINFQPALVPNAFILLFTDKYQQLVEVSQNYYRLFPLKDVKQRSLAETLGITDQEENRIYKELLAHNKFREQLVRATGLSGKQDVWLSGLTIITHPNEYSGAVLLLRMFTEYDDINDRLSDNHKSLITNLLRKTENHAENEIRQFLWDYYVAYLKSLFNFAFHEGGAGMSQLLLDELQETSRRNGWGLSFNPQTIVDNGFILNPDIPLEAPSVLLEAAKGFASHLTDAAIVDAVMQEARSQFSEAVHRTAVKFGELGEILQD